MLDVSFFFEDFFNLPTVQLTIFVNDKMEVSKEVKYFFFSKFFNCVWCVLLALCTITSNFLIFLKKLKEKTPLKRVGKAEELVSTVLYLASKSSSFTTGANIPVDGGWTAW